MLTYCLDSRSPTSAVGVTIVSIGETLQSGFPGPQPVSPRKIRVGEAVAYRVDEVVDAWFATVR